MKKILFILLLIEGVLLSSSIKNIKIGDSSIPIIYEEDNNLPIVTMKLIFKNSGSLFDENRSGLARFSAKMLNEGTKKRGSVGFATALEDLAIHFSAGVGKETMVMEISSLKEQFSKAVSLLKELLIDPNLTQKSFEKVKLLTLAMIEKKVSDFDYVANVNLKKSLYKGTPLQNPAIGTKESLEKIKLDDIKEFLSTHLNLNSAIVVCGGDLSNKEAIFYAKDILEVLKSGKVGKLPYYTPVKKSEFIEVFKDTKQAYIYFGAPYNVQVDSKDRYISRVAMFILGSGGFGSRMMEEIRVKKGLAYSAYSRAEITKSHSEFLGHLQTKVESKDDAIKLVKKVISDFVKDGATQDELDQAKRFILGSEPLRNETLSQRLSKAFHDYYEGFELGHSKKELEKIKDLELSKLNSFIKSHTEINNLTFSIVTKK